MSSHRLFYLALGLIVLGMVSAQLGAYYYLHRLYSPAASQGGTVNTLINYGNSTIKWYNQTSISGSENFYDLTVSLVGGNIEAQFYGPPLNEHFVTAINGVKNHSPYFWTIWILCQRQNAWEVSPVGADAILVGNGQTLAWAYGIPDHSPVPGSRTADSCS